MPIVMYKNPKRDKAHKEIVSAYYDIKERILNIPSPKMQVGLTLLFIGGLRLCELLGGRTRYGMDLQNSKPAFIKPLMREDFEQTILSINGKEHDILKVRVQIAKKGKLLARYFYLVSDSFDGWAYDLVLDYINELPSNSSIMVPAKRRPLINVTHRYLQTRCWKYIGCPPHDLRHARMYYLVNVLKIDPFKITHAMGWSDPRYAYYYSNIREVDFSDDFIKQSVKLQKRFEKRETELSELANQV